MLLLRIYLFVIFLGETKISFNDRSISLREITGMSFCHQDCGKKKYKLVVANSSINLGSFYFILRNLDLRKYLR